MLGIVVIAGILDLIGSHFLKEDRIGSFYENNEYTAKYFVNVFPENGKSKNYRVVAEIRASYNEYWEEDQDGNSHPEYERVYYLNKVYFDNSHTLDFDEEELELNKRTLVRDNNGKSWYVELTDKKVE